MTEKITEPAKITEPEKIIEALAGLNALDNPKINISDGSTIIVHKVTSFSPSGKKSGFRVIPNGGRPIRIPLARIASVEASS